MRASTLLMTVALFIVGFCAFAAGRLSVSTAAFASPERYARLVNDVSLKAGSRSCQLRTTYGGAERDIARISLPHRPVSVDYAWSPAGDKDWTYSAAGAPPELYFFQTSESLTSNKPVTKVTRLTIGFHWTGHQLVMDCYSKKPLGLGVRFQYDVVYRTP